jgi:hypothetical protein
MKVLLLTDVPPCTDFSGAMLTLHLCRFLPPESLVCYCVSDPQLDRFAHSSELQIPVERMHKPREKGERNGGKRFGIARSFLRESHTACVKIPRIAKQVADFGRRHGADRLWCILQGQTMIRLALPVARRLGVPLLTQIWDHPSWWFDAHGVDPISAHFAGRLYERVLRESDRIGAASFVMAEEYERKYGVSAIPFLGSIERKLVRSPPDDPPLFQPHRDTLLVGLAGQIYSKQEWNALLAALGATGWTLAGKKVRIRFLGREFQTRDSGLGADKLEVMGYRAQEETIRLMAGCDILYCPYFFDEQHREVARTSFPCKVTTYLAAGRPILFHGPDYAAPAVFLKQHSAAEFCHSLKTEDLLRSISRLALDAERYRAVAANGRTAVLEHLTFDSLRAHFHRFIGDEDNRLSRKPDSEHVIGPASPHLRPVSASAKGVSGSVLIES